MQPSTRRRQNSALDAATFMRRLVILVFNHQCFNKLVQSPLINRCAAQRVTSGILPAPFTKTQVTSTGKSSCSPHSDELKPEWMCNRFANWSDWTRCQWSLCVLGGFRASQQTNKQNVLMWRVNNKRPSQFLFLKHTKHRKDSVKVTEAEM